MAPNKMSSLIQASSCSSWILMKVSMREDMAVIIPAFPTSMRVMMILRRKGCPVTLSASRVVKPTPVSADLAWNLAACLDKPVCIREMDATLVISIDIEIMIIKDINEIIG